MAEEKKSVKGPQNLILENRRVLTATVFLMLTALTNRRSLLIRIWGSSLSREPNCKLID